MGQHSLRPDRAAASAVTLRLAGASFAEIAETLELTSAAAARSLVLDQLAHHATDASRDELRVEESARLLRLLRSIWPKANNPDHDEHLPAAQMALRIIDRHIRLNGLDAPGEITVHAPTVAEIDAWVATVTHAQIAQMRALEADVTAIETTALDEAS